ncbi:MAG: dephospho-CoA kinase [Candidatus Riflebacteria bacterium]|nr:dephospho-CoA kinase [Candidatus Riflebacteria bacterium]
MKVIGISGQTGAGKTTFSKELEKTLSSLFSVIYIDVDSLGHQVLKDPLSIEALTKAFGEDILTDSQIDRKKLGAKAFESTQNTELLNSIMHPRMVKIVEDIIESNKKDSGSKVIIIDAALLYKMNLARLCDKIIYVEADSEIRVQRLMATRGWTEERARQRLFSQDKEPEGFKLKVPAEDSFSNFRRFLSFFMKDYNLLVFENNGTKEDFNRIFQPLFYAAIFLYL